MRTEKGEKKKRIVLCGSMRFVQQMQEWKQRLEAKGYEVETPTLFDFHTVRDEEGDLARFEDIKRRESKNHFEKVQKANILLILNYDKDGKENYIYTVNPLPKDPLIHEELSAWKIKQWEEYEQSNT